MTMKKIVPAYHSRTAEPRLDAVEPKSTDVACERAKSVIPGASVWALAAPGIVSAAATHTNPLLLYGECGSGKQMLARLIHETSDRAGRPFHVLPVHGFSESVLHSMLFEPPATLPPSIREMRRDIADQAAGGTIYVEDLVDVSAEFRGRIARYTTEPPSEHTRRVMSRDCDVRIIFGASAESPYRADGRSIVRIPPLRERVADIGPLADHFAESLCARLGKEPRVMDSSVLAAFEAYSWPGNVGELKRVIELALRRSGPPAIRLTELPSHLATGIHVDGDGSGDIASGIVLHEAVARYERHLLNQALERCAGVQTHAARLLGVKVSTLNSKLAALNIDPTIYKYSRAANRQQRSHVISS